MDDTVIMPHSHKALIEHWDLVLSLFCHLGLQVHLAKSNLSPTQDFVFLSLHWNTVFVSMSLTPEKVTKPYMYVVCIIAHLVGDCRSSQC